MGRLLLNKPVKVRLFLTYFLLFALPIFFMGLVRYNMLTEMAKSRTETSYHNSLHNLRETIDKQFQDLNNLTVHLSQTRWVRKMMVRKLSIKEIGLTSVLEYNEELLVYNAANHFVNQMAIYFRDKNTVLSSLGKNMSEFFFTESMKVDDHDYEWWKNLTSSYLSGKILIPEFVYINGSPKKGILYLQSLPPNNNTYERATF